MLTNRCKRVMDRFHTPPKRNEMERHEGETGIQSSFRCVSFIHQGHLATPLENRDVFLPIFVSIFVLGLSEVVAFQFPL
jgi:hypothetical protein